MEKKICVRLYCDSSDASKKVEDELKMRRIRYVSLMDQSDRPRPAIIVTGDSKIGHRVYEGYDDIQLFFGLLDGIKPNSL